MRRNVSRCSRRKRPSRSPRSSVSTSASRELNIFRTLFHRPAAAKAISDLLLSLLLNAELSHRLRELVIMRIGWLTGCDYEWTQHWPLAQDMGGCTPDRAARHPGLASSRLLRRSGSGGARRDGRAARHGAISPTRAGRVVYAALGRDASVDLVAAIGTWSMISTLARGLRVPLEEGVESWPPEGEASPAEVGGGIRSAQ